MQAKWQRRKTLPLASRLFLSHLVVMVVGLTSFIIISKASSHHLFSQHLDRLEGAGFAIRSARTALLDGFAYAWNSSTAWSLLVGAIMAAGLSYQVAQRITQPLARIEQVQESSDKRHRRAMSLSHQVDKLKMLSPQRHF